MSYLIVLTLLASPASVLENLNRVVHLHGAVIAPDGGRVAWVEQAATPDGPAPDRSFIDVKDGAQTFRLTPSPADAHDLAFSPDGRSLAYLSDIEKPHQLQLYVADLATRNVRRLTHADGRLAHPRFSPDGRNIAVLYIAGGAEMKGPLGPAQPLGGVVGETIREQRIAVVAADGSSDLRAISPADLFVYEYDWRPDGGAFAATAAHGSGDDNWWIAKLYVFDLAGGPRVVHAPRWQICEPRFSPDGARIAFVEGLMSDFSANGGDLFAVDANGKGPARNLTPGFRGSISTVRWIERDAITAGAIIEGDSAFVRVPAAGGAPRVLARGAFSTPTDWSLAADGKTSAFVRESLREPPEIVAGPIGAWTEVTSRNASVKSPAGEARSIRWKSDGFDVQGWLLAPPSTAKKAPMIVAVHGGPASAARSTWFETPLLLASQGYYVFLPNPRGSFGQGEKFTQGNVKDFGYGDLRDILRGVDAAVREAPIDPQRVGIYGHSYGGYMTMWAVTQTRRFKAAVASAGIANWQSYYGENLIDQWMIPYFGKSVYDDPAIYARSSPITFIKRVKTPTLVLHGERDAEVPLPQGQEFWHALKTLGVETQLVIYEGEGHHLRKPEHARDHIERIVRWFDGHLK